MSTVALSRTSTTSSLQNGADLGGRLLLASLFLIAGLGKISAYDGTAAYMTAMGVPSALLPAVIAVEVLGAVALITGFKTRITAVLLAGFTLAAGVLFHSNFADQIQMLMFWKNVSIAGGLLVVAAYGAGAWSLDGRSAR